jgi:hypothetical protein
MAGDAMIPATTIAKLATLGLSPSQAEIVASMLTEVEQATEAKSEAAIEARRSNDRERKDRQRHVKSREVTGTGGTGGTEKTPELASESADPSRARVLYAEESSSKIPLSETTSPHPQTAKRRASRLAADFSPSHSMRLFARAEGMTDREIDAEGETIRDWSLSSPAGAKLDWEATWRGWIKRRKQQAQTSVGLSGRAKDAEFVRRTLETDDEPRHSPAPDFFDGPTIDAVATRVS